LSKLFFKIDLGGLSSIHLVGRVSLFFSILAFPAFSLAIVGIEGAFADRCEAELAVVP